MPSLTWLFPPVALTVCLTPKTLMVIRKVLLLTLIAATLFLLWQKKLAADSDKGTSITNTDTVVRQLERELSKNTKDINLYIQLANSYNQKVRETADVSYYAKIDELMQRAEKIDPNNSEVFATRALVAQGRHDFSKARQLAEAALKQNPHPASYYGLLGDALLELGEYEQAAESYQQMMDVRPDFASFSRTAIIREVYGDIEGAKEALEFAISASSSYTENIAWSHVELGKIAMRSSLDEAEKHFQQALSIYKDYPAALEGLGKIAFAKNDYKKAHTYFNKALSILPIAQYAIDLADTYLIIGEVKKAEQQYTLAKIAFEKSQTSGVNTDLETAQFLADHHLELEKALDLAQAAYQARPSIFAADNLAWTLYTYEDYEEAENFISEALRLGEHDPLILFHAGMIAEKHDQKDEAKRFLEKALSLNPYFSLQYSKVANDKLKNL